MRVDCDLEFGRWTVRADGHFVIDFPWWRRGRVYAMAFRLRKIINSRSRRSGGPSLAMQRHGPTWKAWKKLCDAFAERRKPIQLHGRDAEIMIESIKRDLRIS